MHITKWTTRSKVVQIFGAGGKGGAALICNSQGSANSTAVAAQWGRHQSEDGGRKDAADLPDTERRAGRRGESPGGGAAERRPSLHLRQLRLTEESSPGFRRMLPLTTTTMTMMKMLG